jgi:hypothetical protein
MDNKIREMEAKKKSQVMLEMKRTNKWGMPLLVSLMVWSSKESGAWTYINETSQLEK